METPDFLLEKNYRRAQRRHFEQKYVIKRLNKMSETYSGFGGFKNVNKVKKVRILLSDFLETWVYFSSKTYTTDKWTTRFKRKYSPNRNKYMYRYNSKNTRLYEKKLLLKELKENGIK
jgi:hypothetical protein